MANECYLENVMYGVKGCRLFSGVVTQGIIDVDK